jgi:hypothetical protein
VKTLAFVGRWIKDLHSFCPSSAKVGLGPNLVVSPSHEAILPNVSLENVLAMAEAARE